MTPNNSKLRIAYWLVAILGYFAFFLGILYFLIAIHFSIAPEYYNSLQLSSTMLKIEVKDGLVVSSNLSNMPLWLIWLVFLQGIAIFCTIGIMCNFGKRIIQAVREAKVFSDKNPNLFRKIGLGFLILAGLSLFDIGITGDVQKFEIQFKMSYILAALFAYILAEIFQEGNRLEEESKFTV
ncbi:MAG: DUF2975 domain-containing protein [Flavobacteriales bacterium]|nr:MAG: DUF2975 domain-containing protein [Flavobacteriales bacterium]